MLYHSPNPLLNSCSLEKLVNSIAKLNIRKHKIGFSIFLLGKVNNCVFFLNCCHQYKLRFPTLKSAHYYDLFTTILVSLKMEKKILWQYNWYHPFHSLVLAKFCNTIKIILYFTCSIIFFYFILFLCIYIFIDRTL